MSDKISPSSVIKEACALVWARKFTFLGLVPIFLAGILLMVAIDYVFPDPDPILLLPAGIVHIVAAVFVLTLVYHLMMTWQRGEARLMPDELLSTMWGVFVRYIIFFLVLFAISAVVGVVLYPLTLGVFLQNDVSFDFNSPKFIVMILIVLIGAFLWLICSLRLSVMMPGASVKEIIGVKAAWQMTRGHSWRMFWSNAIVFFGMMIVEMVLVAARAVIAPNIESGPVLIQIMNVMLPLAQGLMVLLSVAINAVWYERLRLRHVGATQTPDGFAFTEDASQATPTVTSQVTPDAKIAEVEPSVDEPENTKE